jgi:acyl carrier protein
MSSNVNELLNEAYASVFEEGDVSIDFNNEEILNDHFSNLGLESLKILEMVGYLEEKLGFELSDDEIATLTTVGDVKKLIEEKK